MVPAGKRRWTYYTTLTLPNALDIVWCKFPDHLRPGHPGPKPRPALVRSIGLSKDHSRAELEVTYGTSNTKSDSRLLDLIIGNANELALMGLPQATRFDLDLTLWLPWCSEFFVPRPGQPTPVIGHLTQTTISQLETLKVLRRGK